MLTTVEFRLTSSGVLVDGRNGVLYDPDHLGSFLEVVANVALAGSACIVLGGQIIELALQVLQALATFGRGKTVIQPAVAA